MHEEADRRLLVLSGLGLAGVALLDINAILFRTRTGIPWRDLPERFGPWETAAGRHRRWCIDGTWQRIADRLRIDAARGEELIASIDSTTVRAHQHAAGAAKKGTQRGTNRTDAKRSDAPGAD